MTVGFDGEKEMSKVNGAAEPQAVQVVIPPPAPPLPGQYVANDEK